MARVLLLIPSRTYRTHDFMAAASRLGIEVVVGSEHRPALAGLMDAGFLFRTRDGAFMRVERSGAADTSVGTRGQLAAAV